jgi:hypothetical protein
MGMAFKSLSESLSQNIKDLSSASNEGPLLHTLRQVRTSVWVAEPMALQVARTAVHYDFNGVKGNGFRSLLLLLQRCLNELSLTSEECQKSRESIWRRHKAIRRNLIDFGVSVLDNLLYRVLETAVSLHVNGSTSLFAALRTFEEVFRDFRLIDRASILGRLVLCQRA